MHYEETLCRSLKSRITRAPARRVTPPGGAAARVGRHQHERYVDDMEIAEMPALLPNVHRPTLSKWFLDDQRSPLVLVLDS